VISSCRATQTQDRFTQCIPGCFNGSLRKTIREDRPDFPGDTHVQRLRAI
jgi:hypothetical protein